MSATILAFPSSHSLPDDWSQHDRAVYEAQVEKGRSRAEAIADTVDAKRINDYFRKLNQERSRR